MGSYTTRNAGQITRRFKTDLNLTSGVTDLSKKFRASMPGKSPKARIGMASTYKLQKDAKQLVRFYYGISEKYMLKTFKKATRIKGDTGEIMLQLLEARLDNVVFRAGFASTRRAARQLVSHGKVRVNGSKVTVSSYLVSVEDNITIMESSQKQQSILVAIELAKQREPIEWIEGVGGIEVVLKSMPERKMLPAEFKMNMIIELYKR